ncbi:ATP-binding protein [Streptomyces sp. Tu 4128]|uniref:ATP-binding protein n=1 Tax=Streptomyces sp. Tu 4128 TaxID=1120314 RepID=UPI0013CEB098|nr:ATP-binding protein [Streptomyces sp. Tu 4128]
MTTAEMKAGWLEPPLNAATARDRVRELLLTCDPAPPSQVTDDILLVVTELVTNAGRHGGGLIAFDARLVEGTITISVTDASPVVPHTHASDRADAPGGFGWPLIQLLSDEVSVRTTAAGKTIRAVLGTTAHG